MHFRSSATLSGPIDPAFPHTHDFPIDVDGVVYYVIGWRGWRMRDEVHNLYSLHFSVSHSPLDFVCE